jgi:hypothetical protein
MRLPPSFIFYRYIFCPFYLPTHAFIVNIHTHIQNCLRAIKKWESASSSWRAAVSSALHFNFRPNLLSIFYPSNMNLFVPPALHGLNWKVPLPYYVFHFLSAINAMEKLIFISKKYDFSISSPDGSLFHPVTGFEYFRPTHKSQFLVHHFS